MISVCECMSITEATTQIRAWPPCLHNSSTYTHIHQRRLELISIYTHYGFPAYTVVVGIPLRWSALETIHYGRFSTASDVWALGVVMYVVIPSFLYKLLYTLLFSVLPRIIAVSLRLSL